MPSVLGCMISPALVDRWAALLVHEVAPFFVPDAAQALFPQHVVTFSRAEFRHVAPSLEFCDSYTTWAVHADGTHVALLSPTEFRALPRDTQQALVQWQWQFGRGQVYDACVVQSFLSVSEWEATCAHALFATPDGDKVALDHALWWSLTRASQWRWLMHFLTEDRSICLSNTLTRAQWSHLTTFHGPSLRHLAGSFASSSGPNCFSTTLAAATRSSETATTIAALWLTQSPFVRGLAARGYARDATLSVNASLPAGTMLVWVDTQDTPQHACYVLGEGLVLNKDAQAWYVPRQILSLSTVLEQWHEDHVRIHVYTRAGRTVS